MNKKVAELIKNRAEILDEAKSAVDAGKQDIYESKMAEAGQLAKEIEARQSIDAEAGRFKDDDFDMVSRSEVIESQKAESIIESKQDNVRKGNEYAQAFAFAMKHGVSPHSNLYRDKLKPLYNALTIAGGEPVGEDGGFLVPIDMDNMIIEVKRDNRPLAPLFNVETVSTATGWRVIDKHPTAGFTKLNNELGDVLANDQPEFAKINYSLDTYGLYIPMSRELVDDEVANLMRYLASWIGKKEVLTENALLIALLQALTEVDLTTNAEFAEIKAVLNSGLDPAHSAVAGVITNQSGLALLDALEDLNGRPLMQPDVVRPTDFRISGRPVTAVADAQLANTEGTVKSPIYIGDFKSYATLFRRKAIEIASTDVGGDAWRKYGHEVRAITRLDAVVFDSTAVNGVNFAHGQ